ncbi:MAG: SMC family ATPase [Chloroflexi bacterium]|nr:SMC family ATPase [Chloroflexota bacterium]
MIPVRLQVRNFLCYSDNAPVLDFAGIHVACLSGANGHGKSALLDAITWALWGKARARQDDQLIHQGQTDMDVEFDFLMDGQLYRVIRKRTSRGRGQSALELQADRGGKFVVLTEDSQRATQARINAILRMDYDTFINSAFLVQGRADEFTVKAPAERKQVLADILGLALYDRAEEIAKDHARQAEQEIAHLTGEIQNLDGELKNLAAYRDEEKALALESESLTRQREDAERATREAEVVLSGLQQKKRELDELAARRAQDERALRDREQRRESVLKQMAVLEALLAEEADIKAGYQRLLEAREREAALASKGIRANQLNAEAVRLEGRIAQARQKLALELEHAQKQAADKEAEAQKAESLRAKRAQVARELEALDEKERQRDALRQSIQDSGLEAERLRSENERLRREMADLRGKIDQLGAAGATCPLCRSPLSDESRQRLIEDMTAEGRAKKEQFTANQNRMQALDAERERLERELGALDAALKGRGAKQREEAALSEALARAETAVEEAKRLREAAADIQRRLEREEFAQDERKRLAEVQAEIRALDYDPQAHEEARRALQALAEYETKHANLLSASQRIDGLRADIARYEEEIAQFRKALAESGDRKVQLEAELATLPRAEADAKAKRAEAESLAERERRARDRLAMARQKLEYCDRLAARREEKSRALEEARSNKSLYDDLRLAFGKKGIQAMIIESIIPEIQDEANALLQRMTDGRMQVTLQTQRDTKSGTTVETLEIHISDELGSRPYELFSGGEAFRVNFAIRVALSKLLARRAGAQLRTLIIDEGFGSQDAAGRRKLVEAIQSVQDDFDKILVITHVEELQDAFPVRIHVEKTAAGSTFSIM